MEEHCPHCTEPLPDCRCPQSPPSPSEAGLVLRFCHCGKGEQRLLIEGPSMWSWCPSCGWEAWAPSTAALTVHLDQKDVKVPQVIQEHRRRFRKRSGDGANTSNWPKDE